MDLGFGFGFDDAIFGQQPPVREASEEENQERQDEAFHEMEIEEGDVEESSLQRTDSQLARMLQEAAYREEQDEEMARRMHEEEERMQREMRNRRAPPVWAGVPQRRRRGGAFEIDLRGLSPLVGAPDAQERLRYGDKILLPAQCLQELSEMNHDGPMLFQIEYGVMNKVISGSVLEFTAPPGCAVLPKWMMDYLGASEHSDLTIRLVTLPKATFLKLRPVNYGDFKQLQNHKAVLESTLAQYYTLTRGSTVAVPFQGQEFFFEVVESSPDPMVCILNADVETDFDLPDDYFDAMDIDVGDDDVEEEHEDGVQALQKEEQFTGHGRKLDTSGPLEGDYVVCETCGKQVPSLSAARHQAFCARNMWRCEVCGKRVKASEREAHEQEHAPVTCECGEMVVRDMLETHKLFACDMRKEECDYCRIFFTLRELRKHREACGSRTDKCMQCQRFVMKRDMREHAASNCEYYPQGRRYEAPIFVCPECEAPSLSVEALQTHVIEYHTDEGIALRMEREKSETATLLEEQQRALGVLDVMECPQCAQSFTAFDKLERHIAIEHGDEDMDEDEDDFDEGIGDESSSSE